MKSVQDGKSSSLRLNLISFCLPVTVADLIYLHLFCRSGCHMAFFPCRWCNWKVSSSSLVEFTQEPVRYGRRDPTLTWRYVALKLRISSFPAMQSVCCDPNYFVVHQELTKSKDDCFMRAIYFQRSCSAVRFGALDIPCLFPLSNLTYPQSLHL